MIKQQNNFINQKFIGQNRKSPELNIEVAVSKSKPEIVIEDVSKAKVMQDSDNNIIISQLIKLILQRKANLR